jgi:hypothetical protein
MDMVCLCAYLNFILLSGHWGSSVLWSSRFYACDYVTKKLMNIKSVRIARQTDGKSGGRKRKSDTLDCTVRKTQFWYLFIYLHQFQNFIFTPFSHPNEYCFNKYIFKLHAADNTEIRALVWYDWTTRPYDIGIKTEYLTQRAQL